MFSAIGLVNYNQGYTEKTVYSNVAHTTNCSNKNRYYQMINQQRAHSIVERYSELHCDQMRHSDVELHSHVHRNEKYSCVAKHDLLLQWRYE